MPRSRFPSIGKSRESPEDRGPGQMSVSGAVGRAVSASGVTAVPAAAFAEVGVGRARISIRTSPRSDSGRLPPGFARTHSSATGPPRNPRRSAAATARPRLVFATVSWRLLPPAHTRSLRPFPHSRAVSDSFIADFNRQVSEQHATIFDWSDRLRTYRIPTPGKVPCNCRVPRNPKNEKKGRRPARGSWRSELVP